ATAFEFTGKLILLANGLPAVADVEAFKSRALYYPIRLIEVQRAGMLYEAALSPRHYSDPSLATRVAKHLLEKLSGVANVRTLNLGYELALENPDSWEFLLDRMIPNESPRELARSLATGGGTVNAQIRVFQRTTGLSRRTFFNYRRAKF